MNRNIKNILAAGLLKQELTYPMAWGNSPIKNFKKWKKAARAKVLEKILEFLDRNLK